MDKNARKLADTPPQKNENRRKVPDSWCAGARNGPFCTGARALALEIGARKRFGAHAARLRPRAPVMARTLPRTFSTIAPGDAPAANFFTGSAPSRPAGPSPATSEPARIRTAAHHRAMPAVTCPADLMISRCPAGRPAPSARCLLPGSYRLSIVNFSRWIMTSSVWHTRSISWSATRLWKGRASVRCATDSVIGKSPSL